MLSIVRNKKGFFECFCTSKILDDIRNRIGSEDIYEIAHRVIKDVYLLNEDRKEGFVTTKDIEGLRDYHLNIEALRKGEDVAINR